MSGKPTSFKVVGKSVPRVDSADKVRGKAVFTDDMKLPGMLHGKIKNSTVAHGRIVRIDTSKAAALPGVVAVITGDACRKPYSVNNYKPSTASCTRRR